MIQLLAQILSTVFHPLLIPAISFWILVTFFPSYYSQFNFKTLKLSLIVVSILTMIGPSIILLMMKALGLIKTVQLKERKERFLPYIILLFFYLSAFLLLDKDYEGNLLIHDFIMASSLLGATIAIAVGFMFNLFFKISAHTMGVSALVGSILLASYYLGDIHIYLCVGLIILSGAVGASRLFLRAHVAKEVYWGYIVGLLSQVVAFGYNVFL